MTKVAKLGATPEFVRKGGAAPAPLAASQEPSPTADPGPAPGSDVGFVHPPDDVRVPKMPRRRNQPGPDIAPGRQRSRVQVGLRLDEAHFEMLRSRSFVMRRPMQHIIETVLIHWLNSPYEEPEAEARLKSISEGEG